MHNKKYWTYIGSLTIFAIIIHLFSAHRVWVENHYSTGIYPFIAVFLRYLLGWLPFSMGDILYGLFVIWLILKIGMAVKRIFTKQFFFREFFRRFLKMICIVLSVYLFFNLLWGINYNRKGIAGQLGLVMEKYSVDELKILNGILLQKVNVSNGLLLQKSVSEISSNEIFARSQDAYKNIHQQYPFLNYHPSSLKKSLWGWLGNYLGFLGYYNPFTGEGQVNTTIPKFLQPFTSCHEIAHQLGYAKENEANFVGYLAAASSKDEFFHYSVYLDLFLYANRNLFTIDSAAANVFSKQLLPGVEADLFEWRKFNNAHKNPIEPVIRWMYGKYLENNEQPSGMLSYDEVTGFMIAYYKKYGKL